MDTKREIARRVRAARLARGLTQAQVAAALGVHRPTISEMEAGRRSISGTELVRIAHALDVPLPTLLPGASAGMAATEVDPAILEMARTIVDRYAPEQVILFGSHARGTAGPDSDVDLLVVLEMAGPRRRMAARVGAALHAFKRPKDVVVTTPEAFETRRHLPGTIERAAALEGRVLHARR